MCAVEREKKPNFLLSILLNRCPRCRRGPIYKYRNPYNLKHFMEMNDRCPVCGQPINLEVGFYYGTGFVSYAIAVLLSGLTFAIWCLFIGVSVHDNRFFWWMGLNAVLLVVLQPPLMRLSRSVWLAFFVRYEKEASSKMMY